MFLAKKNHEISSQKCQSIDVSGFYGTHKQLSSGFTNIASYFLTAKELRLTWLCNLQERQIIEKVGFPQKIVANTQLISSKIRFPSHTLLTDERHLRIIDYDFIFNGSKVIAQTRLRKPIILWPIASVILHNTQKCNAFWLPGAESFSNHIHVCYEWLWSNNFSAATIP